MASGVETVQRTSVTTNDSSCGKPLTENDFNKIIEFLDNKDSLDIYQVIAIRSSETFGSQSCYGYWRFQVIFDLIKAIICVVAQIGSMLVLIIYQVDNSEHGFCHKSGDDISQVMAIIYTFVLWAYLFPQYAGVQDAGLYGTDVIEIGCYSYSFVKSSWLYFGKFMNTLVLVAIFCGSCLLMLFSLKPMDVILNALALVFLVEIDNMFVSNYDYTELKKKFENNLKY
eukprot:428425_1